MGYDLSNEYTPCRRRELRLPGAELASISYYYPHLGSEDPSPIPASNCCRAWAALGLDPAAHFSLCSTLAVNEVSFSRFSDTLWGQDDAVEGYQALLVVELNNFKV